MTLHRNNIIPALLRPGMYAGPQGERTDEQWKADALVVYHQCVCMQTAFLLRVFEKQVDSLMKQLADRPSIGTEKELARKITILNYLRGL